MKDTIDYISIIDRIIIPLDRLNCLSQYITTQDIEDIRQKVKESLLTMTGDIDIVGLLAFYRRQLAIRYIHFLRNACSNEDLRDEALSLLHLMFVVRFLEELKNKKE